MIQAFYFIYQENLFNDSILKNEMFINQEVPIRALILISLLSLFGLNMTGCATYSGVTRVSKSKVLILRNDGLLFGLLRKAMVCDVHGSGVKNCQVDEQP